MPTFCWATEDRVSRQADRFKMSRPRIAVLSSWDTRSRTSWSGTPYYMSCALEKHCGSVVHLGPVRSLVEQTANLGNRISRRLIGRNFPYHHSRLLAREYARIFAKRLRDAGPIDLIFAPAASTQIAMLETDIPILYTSDATFALMKDYNASFRGLNERYASGADRIERDALHRAAAVHYPSDWAARSAIEHYGVTPDKVSVIPWGANFDSIPPAGLATDKRTDRCSLLFLGVDWESKGGPIAHRATQELRKRGMEVTLTVCGCTPPQSYRAEWLEVFARLDKEKPVEQAKLSDLLLRANFLLVPTRYDCFGIAFCEASAHGTPSISTATGGVGSSVADGRSGYLLPPNASPEAYADLIEEIWSRPEAYRELVKSTRNHYDTTVNWDSWGIAISKIIGAVLDD
jgi:glycosyltransferase involved in cell wall biosynthesis